MRLSPHTAQPLWSFSMDFHEASVPISPAPPCIPRGQLARSLGTFVPIFPKARGLCRQFTSWCTWLYWVGTGRVTLRHVSPCPPLDPYVRLSPHTAHDRGILWERSISPAPRCITHGQLCAFAGYLCTVSRPSPSGPSPCARFSRTRTTMPYLTAWRASEFRMSLPMPTLHPPSHPYGRVGTVDPVGMACPPPRTVLTPFGVYGSPSLSCSRGNSAKVTLCG